MKKFISAALCAAMILSMAAVSVSADSFTLTRSKRPYSSFHSQNKEEITALYTVSQPQTPEEIDEQYAYHQENQTPEAFLQSLQSFGAKTASMLLGEGTANQTYSPVSFVYALGILGSGAQGSTQQNIVKALEADSMTEVSEGLHKFYLSNYHDEENNALKIANSLWMQNDYSFHSSFAKNAAQDFYASSYSVDFKKQETADAMAKWISEQTGGLLNPIFEPNPDQVLSIINTLYFTGSWTNSFQAENNMIDKFTLADGTQMDVTYMTQELTGSSYYQTGKYTMVKLPFENGQTMNFVLPAEGASLSSLLDEETLTQILEEQPEESVNYADVTVRVPKFSFDTEFNLNETCESLGLEELFDGSADLSGIADGDVAVSDVKQESHIEIDENGCKAAAYTKMDIMKMSLPIEMEKYIFSLDRPFLFVIESQDDAPLFVGTVYQPAE